MNNKLIPKYQSGNKILPTAQYASIKYDRGTKHIYPHFVWDSKLDPKKDIRGVRANNPLYSEPGEIMREILYSPSTNQPVDTTYREYPTALLPVKIQTRVASSNDQDRKEYEILKRRFNTAWNVSKPNIKYGIFKEGGIIPKYQVGAYFVPYKDGSNTNIMGRSSGKRYTQQEVKDWLKNHGIKITDEQFTNWFTKSNPISYTEYLNWNKSQPTQDKTNKFQWNNNYWAKIGNKYKGLGYNEYMQEFNKWFDQQNFNTLEKDNRNYIAKQNWDKYVKFGYNKPVNTLNDAIVTPAETKQTLPTNEEFDLSENDPLVQKFLKDNGYTKASIETPEYQNGMRYVYNNGKFELIPTEPETVGKQSEAPTYESLVQANTTAFNNGMNSAHWRRNFRKSFNNALLNGDMYGINPNGSQVFDINGMNVSEMIQNIGGLDPRKGLTRRGMRLLKKQQKAYNENIFENVNTKVRTLPFQEISNQELDSLGQDALPQFQVHNHGLDVPFMNPTYEESDEGDIVNIGTKNIPFYQEVKRQ